MPSSASSQRRAKLASRSRSVWVRKNLYVDQRKLDAAKRLFNVATETDAVDAALDEAAFRRRILSGVRALRRAGGIAVVFD